MKKTKLLISIALLTLLVSGCTTTITSSTTSGSSSEEKSEGNTSSDTSNDNDNEEDNNIYKLGAADPSTGVYYYFNGEAATTSNSHFLAVTTSWEQAVDVLIEDLDDGGLSLSFTNSENETKYISWSDGTAVDIADEAYPWYWVEENGVYAAGSKEGRGLFYYADNPSFRAYDQTEQYLAYGHVTPYKSEPDSQDVEPQEEPEPVTGELEEGDYLLGLNVDEVNYYFDGTVYKDYYGNANSDISKAVIISVASYNDGYSLSFTDSDETTQYIYMSESNGHHNFSWGVDKAYAWSYDTTYNTLVSLDSEGNCYFIGCYGSNIEFSMNEYTYLTGEKSTSNTQYPASLYQIPDNWGEEGNEDSQEEEDDTESTKGLLGFEVNGINYYIDGGLVGNYSYEGSVTDNIDEAIEVKAVETEGDNAYYLSFKLNNTTYYVCIIPVTNTSGTFTDLQYTTEKNAIYYDETLDGWVNEDGTYFLCYNETYKCLYASTIEEYGPSGSKGTSPIARIYDYPTIEGITLSADSTQVEETQSLRIDVTYTPSTIGASNLEWESSDNDVATVEDGRVIGVAASDTPVTIKATTKNGLSATIDITVVAYEVPDNLVGTLTFLSSNTAASTDAFTTDKLQTCLSAAYSGTGTITAGDTHKVYPGSNAESGNGLKQSKDCVQIGAKQGDGNDGAFAFTLNDTDTITKVSVKVLYYDSIQNMTINENAISITYDSTAYSSWDDVPEIEYTLTATTSFEISVSAGANRMLIHSIEFYSA